MKAKLINTTQGVFEMELDAEEGSHVHTKVGKLKNKMAKQYNKPN